MQHADFFVIGGGIIGVNIARELRKRFADAKVVLVEKESSGGKHASGRNSGVLHAGFYYTADSLKAKFTRDGNRLLTEYIEEHGIPINKCGKLVVARDEAEDRMLDELLRRGAKNGVALHELKADEVREIEPRAKTYERAIFSPSTASANPLQIMEHMEDDARREGVDVRHGEEYTEVKQRNGVVQARTASETYEAAYVVNAAGLYADKVARDFGFSRDYAILPFKGLYLKSNEPAGAFRTNIYPVPDLNYPFLGVHFTVQVDGRVKIGPTAIPAFWREQYDGFSNFRMREFLDIAVRSSKLFMASEFDFKRLALTEAQKHFKRRMVSLASSLATNVNASTYLSWAKPGIRAQLVNLKQRKLEMDFVLEGDERSMHVLNAVSPGWTCSIPFSRYICDEIEKRLR